MSDLLVPFVEGNLLEGRLRGPRIPSALAYPAPSAGAAFKLEATFAGLRCSHVGLPLSGIARVAE